MLKILLFLVLFYVLKIVLFLVTLIGIVVFEKIVLKTVLFLVQLFVLKVVLFLVPIFRAQHEAMAMAPRTSTNRNTMTSTRKEHKARSKL